MLDVLEYMSIEYRHGDPQQKSVFIEKAGNALVTLLALRVSMGDGDRLLSNGLHHMDARNPTEVAGASLVSWIRIEYPMEGIERVVGVMGGMRVRMWRAARAVAGATLPSRAFRSKPPLQARCLESNFSHG
ncbi:hypothetical protein EVAR_30003_1 [Eumeta japonica]|uniref:Uncharacterized protein n=1 Tax=Eumeta variegata TaxID=151549 RepID=A0A4C1VV06_EUMVA|nr:hypothetical protein EVAR_30003_1 [Eumeta japonica]